MIDNKQIAKWRELCAEIQNATTVVAESEQDKEARIKRLLSDYKAFVSYYFPHYAAVEPAEFHVDAAKKIQKTKNLKALFEWARGHAKSVTFDIAIPMWLKARGELHTMVLVSKSEDNARILLADLQAEFEVNARYISDFGKQMNAGDWQQGQFSTLDGCAFFAKGRGQSPRGLRKKANRPDYIVIDDIDDDELVENPKRTAKLYSWIKSALFGALDMGRGRFVMVGNRIHKDSIVAKMAKNPAVHHTVVNALDKNGKPAWWQKYTLKEILEAQEFMGYREFQKEFMNNPIKEGSVFKKEHIEYIKLPKLTSYRYIVAYCDPSFKETATADFKAVAVVGLTSTGQYHVIDTFARRTSISVLVDWFYRLYSSMTEQSVVCTCYMEANFLQDLVYDEFTRTGLERGYHVPIMPDKRAKPNKEQRITSMEPLFERRLIKFSEHLTKSSDGKEAEEQLTSFEKGSRTADDFPDALEGAIYILNQFVRVYSKEAKPTMLMRERANSY